MAKGIAARLAGALKSRSSRMTETTFDELKARVAKTVEFIKFAAGRPIRGFAETRAITLKLAGNEVGFHRCQLSVRFRPARASISTSRPRTTSCATPALPIGKRDFLGAVPAN